MSFRRAMTASLAILGAISVLAESGCAAIDRVGHADAIAATGGLTREEIRAGDFVLTAYSRISNPKKDVAVYIEGDGLAWLTRTQPSFDPTPVEATGLRLAAVDPGPNVVYLARPCQFTPMEENPRCSVAYWTGRRFSQEVVNSVDRALDIVKTRVPGQRLDLVGYSGGAAVAVLVASHRADIATLRTVAGNLDDEFINSLHGVAPMPESLNPLSVAEQLSSVPQVHIASDADNVVPPEVARRFVAAVGGPCAQAVIVSGIGHDADWQARWTTLRAIAPVCRNSR